MLSASPFQAEQLERHSTKAALTLWQWGGRLETVLEMRSTVYEVFSYYTSVCGLKLRLYEASTLSKGAAALHGLWIFLFLPRMLLASNNASGDASVHKPEELVELMPVSSSTYEVTFVVWVRWSVRREMRRVIRMSGRE